MPDNEPTQDSVSSQKGATLAATDDQLPGGNPDGCNWCGTVLSEEEAAYPRHDDMGNVLCDECHRDHYTFTCHYCENYEDKKQECRVGSLFVVFEPVPARRYWGRTPHWFCRRDGEMRPS